MINIFNSDIGYAVACIIITISCMASYIYSDIIEVKRQKREFNNGICPNCKCKYICIPVEDYGRYYKCPNCKKVVKITHANIDNK